MKATYLDIVVAAQHNGIPLGIASICSSHPLVVEAALRHAKENGTFVLIEATCNQVNQFGGYTGMTPSGFVAFIRNLADQVGLARDRLVMGGDHLGPLPWSKQAPAQAMAHAEELVRSYVQAGFTKIHIDCSMPLGDEDLLPVETIAQRTVRLVKVAEQTAGLQRTQLRYVVGSEVPPAGGARAAETALSVTKPEDVAETVAAMRHAFLREGLEEAWDRVVALVVQPGVEFGSEFVHEYDRSAAAALTRYIKTLPGLVYEAHSTDYQPPHALRALVEDGFAILKVGPWLTFALREAVFSLAAIEAALLPEEQSRLVEAFEEAMLANPAHWQKYYRGDQHAQKLARLYSFSDRIRYYWTDARVRASFERLLRNLERQPIPLSLLSQYMPLEHELVREGAIPNHPRALILARVMRILEIYRVAALGLAARKAEAEANVKKLT